MRFELIVGEDSLNKKLLLFKDASSCPPSLHSRSSAHGAAVPEVPVQLHPHPGRRPPALLHGGRGDPDSAADGPGNPAGGVGQPAQPAGPEDGPHRGHRQGTSALPVRFL